MSRLVLVENAEPAQYESVNAIYGRHVLSGFATFDEEAPNLTERAPWFDQFERTGPHQLLIAQEGGEVFGFACSQPYRTHPAFTRSVEFSIYLDPSATGRGLGRPLYRELIDRARAAGVGTVLSGVALPNEASLALHRSCGFREVGTFRNYAEKRGRIISSMWFQLELTPDSRLGDVMASGRQEDQHS